MGASDKDMNISYQNKDIISKIFGDHMKGKRLSLFGLPTDAQVVDLLPTNIPLLELKELRMDNLFLLEDGSVAILDYESTYEQKDFVKYGLYILHVVSRFLKEREIPRIHMIVIYTADMTRKSDVMDVGACRVQVQAEYLTEVDSEEWLREIREGIARQAVTDEMLMHLVLLPLTYRGKERKQEAIETCVDLAKTIEDKEKESFALAGILAFTDKVISEETRNHMKEVLSMTQVGKMLFDEGLEQGMERGLEQGMERGLEQGMERGLKQGHKTGRKEGDRERSRKVARTMMRNHEPRERILLYSGLTEEEFDGIFGESYTT